MYSLRPYQENAMKDIKDYLDSNSYKKEIIVLGTGAGKSLLIAETAKLVETPLLVLQPSKELLEQNYQKYVDNGFEASIFSASMKQKQIGHVTFATPKSIAPHISKFRELGVKTTLLDECHLQTKVGSVVDSLLKGLGDKTKVLGFTATPIMLRNSMYGAELKMLNRTRDSIMQEIRHVTQIQEIAKEFWTPLSYKIFKTKEESLKPNSNGSDYTEKSLEVYFYENNFVDTIPQQVEELLNTRKLIVIFAPSIASALALAAKIPGSAAFYSGMNDKERSAKIQGIKLGTIRVAINVNILAVGWDETKVDCEILLRPTRSISVHYQQIGRSVRLAKPGETKENSLILDYSGNTSRFGKVEDLTFEKDPVHGWGMFSGNKLLTGYPMDAEPRYKSTRLVATEDLKMWFGKYKDKPLDEVPLSYFEWMIAQNWDFSKGKMVMLKKHIDKVLTGKLGEFASTNTIK